MRIVFKTFSLLGIVFQTVWKLVLLVCTGTKRRMSSCFSRCFSKEMSYKEDKYDEHTGLLHQECENLRTALSEAQRNEKSLQETIAKLEEQIESMRPADIANRAKGRYHIANESDQRMKLSEAFGNLYDEEWRDVMRAIFGDKTEELVGIKFLSDILQDSQKYCQDAAKKQLVKFVFFPRKSPETEIHINQILKPGELNELLKIRAAIGHHNDVNEALFKPFWEPKCKEEKIRKLWNDTGNIADEVVNKNVGQGCDNKIPTETKGNKIQENVRKKKLEAYAYKCINLCWQFAIMDPPVVLLFDVKGKNFKDIAEKFQEYPYFGWQNKGQNSDTVQMVVWPALISQRADETKGRLIGDAKGHVILGDGSSVDPEKESL